MKKKKVFKLLGLASLVLLLAACGQGEVNAQSTALWDRYFVYYLQQLILWLSSLFGNNYAVGIILFTVITRIVMLPLTNYQSKTMRKTAEIQPEIKKLREQYTGRDRETQLELQQEIRKVNEKHGVNQWAGCLPMLIQMPLMFGLFDTINRTPILHEGTFFWTSLGSRDAYFILPIIAAFFTWLKSYLTLQGQKKEAQTGRTMQLYVLPTMILFFGMNVLAALALYWAVGNIFDVAQTLVFQNPFKIRAEREEKERLEREKQKALRKAMRHAKKK